jgi:hypothetical protein
VVLGPALGALALGGAAWAGLLAGTVSVKVTVTGSLTAGLAGSRAEDSKNLIPAKNACTRLTKPKKPAPGLPLSYTVNFGDLDVITFRPGLLFSFPYNAKRVGSPQKLYNGKTGGANLVLITSSKKGVTLQPGWSGTVTLNADLRSGSFAISGARDTEGGGKVAVQGTWRCSVTYVRAT